MQIETVINIQQSFFCIAAACFLFIWNFNEAVDSIKWKAFWVIILFGSSLGFIISSLIRIWM